MTDFYPDLEIGLHRPRGQQGGGRPDPTGEYQVELRLHLPDSETRLAPERGAAALDLEALRDARDDPASFGNILADTLFHEDNVRRLLIRALEVAAARPLRLRLVLPIDDLELHELPWELLHDPETQAPLGTAENVFFSRFLRSRDYRTVELGARTRLATLVAVATPTDLASYDMANLNATAEVQRVRGSLCPSGSDHEVGLTVTGQDEPLTLERLAARLRNGNGGRTVDVLHLVCHSLRSRNGVPIFLLQTEDGTAAPIGAEKLARVVAELRAPPRLVVLDGGRSSDRAASAEPTAESALAPRLAEAGVAAILTLPGQLDPRTADQILPVFYRELLVDGRLDRALAVARAVATGRGDAWMPALYLRLRRGALWRPPRRTSVYICSSAEELAPYRKVAGDVVRELGMELRSRREDGLPGFQPVTACRQQVAAADLVLALVGHQRGDVPDVELGGDGSHPWTWWETRAAFEEGLPVAALMAADAWRSNGDPESPNDSEARDVISDYRGELRRLATVFEEDADDESFRDRVRRQLLSMKQAQSAGHLEPVDAEPGVELRRWPPPQLPEQPYPVLLPYTHPDLMAGRDLELDKLHQLLTRPVPILGLHAPSGSGKSSLLAAGLVPGLRADGRPVALDRHPTEPGIVTRLLGDLLATGGDGIREDDPHAFVDRLRAIRRVAGVQPVLVLDQFEDLLRQRGAVHARAIVGTLLAASVQRQPGLSGPPCRWLLAYRQEFHGEVFKWLGDVLSDARSKGLDGNFPHDLSSSDRFFAWPLAPLGTPAPGAGDRVEAAARIFQAAIEKPLTLTSPEGEQLYRYRFAGDSAARLARAFGEARVARHNAPLAPELQVVLAHLLDAARQTDDDGRMIIEVPDNPGELIDQALEEHLKRSLDVAFPIAKKAKAADARIQRTRAILALRELADAQGRHDAGRPVTVLARAIGMDGRKILEKLATVRTRLVLLESHGDEHVYVLSHDRMAEVVVRLVDEEDTYAGLGVDAELLGLRRFVAVQRELFTSGEVEQSTVVPRDRFSGIERHVDALLWDDEARRWWRACRERRRLDQRQKMIRRGFAAAVLVLSALLGGIWADRYFKRQALLETIAEGEPEEAFAALAALTAESDVGPRELLDRVQQREQPFDVLEHGLGGVEKGRGAALLRVAELLLALVGEDPVRIASSVWALDFFAGPEPALREQAIALRDEILEPLRRRRPPPPIPAPGDPHWADIPAGTFWMGAGPDDGRNDPNMQDEFPRHQVTLSAFRMMVHEVTNAELRRLWPEHGDRWSNYPGEDNRPAVRVSWHQAYTYAAWLGGRLPTESEWEYAARAGCAYAYCRRDGSETILDEVAWWADNSADPGTGEPSSKPVMQLEPNPWRLWDVYGNVEEWNATWYGAYPQAPQKDPPGPTDTVLHLRTARGGSASNPKEWVLASGRGVGSPNSIYNSHGLRVVIAAALPSEVKPS